MAKKIVYPCELKVDFDEVGEITVSAHYGVESEGVGTRRGMELKLSATEITLVKKFVSNVVVPKVLGREGI